MFRFVLLSAVVALVAAEPSLVAPLWAGSVAAPWAAGIAAPLAAPWGLAAPIGAANYRGPLSLAPGQPANILAADGRPLDTLSVNVDRAAHYTAKVLDQGVVGAHLLKKRSIVGAPVVAAPLGWTGVAASAVAAPLGWTGVAAARVIAPAPIAVAGAAPIAAVGWGHAARWGQAW